MHSEAHSIVECSQCRPRCDSVQEHPNSVSTRSAAIFLDDFFRVDHCCGVEWSSVGLGWEPFELCLSAPPSRKMSTPYLRNLILEYDCFSRIRCTFLHFVTLFHTILESWPHSFDRYSTQWDSSCTLIHYASLWVTLLHCIITESDCVHCYIQL